MLFNYQAVDATGAQKVGSIDAVNVDIAIASLQRRGLVLTTIAEADKPSSFLSMNLAIFDRVSNKDVVILSRQLSTLFEAQVSALRVFRLLGAETEKRALAVVLEAIADDLQAGNSISGALEKHPKVFSEFYVSMVKAGEESGKLNDTFQYLADYLDRTYELTSKVRGSLIYPAFVVVTFISVMILMFTVIIPKITPILQQSGATIPVYTQIIIGISNFLVQYGFVILGALVVGVFFLVRFIRTPPGRMAYDRAKLTIPYGSSLYRKLYLSRFADNMNTMLSSGISMVRALELTSSVINNGVYKRLFLDAIESVKSGVSLSDSLSADPKAIPGIMTQMIKIGEEAGAIGPILKTLSNFYAREVTTAVDAMVSLIEPVMIVVMGAGVAILMAAVLVPIYSIASSSGS